jgi:hypothetical protein
LFVCIFLSAGLAVVLINDASAELTRSNLQRWHTEMNSMTEWESVKIHLSSEQWVRWMRASLAEEIDGVEGDAYSSRPTFGSPTRIANK